MAKRGYKTPGKTGQEPSERPLVQPVPTVRLFRYDLKLLKRHFEATLVILVMPALLLELGMMITDNRFEATARGGFASVLAISASIWLALGAGALYYLQLRAVGGYSSRIRDCYRYGLRFIPRLAGLAIIVGLTILTAGLLLIVPGLIMLRRYILAPLFLVDEDLGIREAMQRSAAATKRAGRFVYATLAVIGVIGLVGLAIDKYLTGFGGSLAIVLSLTFFYFPALRYRELALNENLDGLLEPPAASSAIKE